MMRKMDLSDYEPVPIKRPPSATAPWICARMFLLSLHALYVPLVTPSLVVVSWRNIKMNGHLLMGIQMFIRLQGDIFGGILQGGARTKLILVTKIS